MLSKRELSDLVDLSNQEKLLKDKLKDVQLKKGEIEESVISEMKSSGKIDHRLGLFFIRLKRKEKLCIPESKSPLRKKLEELLQERQLLSVCSNLYTPKISKLLKDKSLQDDVKEAIEQYVYTENVYSVSITVEPPKDV